MKYVSEAKPGGARGAGLDRRNKTKRFGEAGKTSSLMFGLVTICRNTSGQGSRDKRPH